MSIGAAEAAPTHGSGTTGDRHGPSGRHTTAGGDKEMFLQLLVAQMKYQDPMNPTDSSQFLAQSAQFTALEKMQDVADKTAQLVSAQVAFGASGLVGRQVTWTSTRRAPPTPARLRRHLRCRRSRPRRRRKPVAARPVHRPSPPRTRGPASTTQTTTA